MKHPLNGSSRGVSPRFPLAAAAGIAALMLAALVQPAAAASFQAPDIKVDEGEKAVFKIALPQTYSYIVRYPYQTQDGTAKSGRHYDAKQGHLVFNAGTRSLKVEVQTRVNQDATTRDFNLALSEAEVFFGGLNPPWNPAWLFDWLPDFPSSKTIRATIRDTYIGATGPE